MRVADNVCWLSDLNLMRMMLMMNRVRQIMDYVLPFHQSKKKFSCSSSKILRCGITYRSKSRTFVDSIISTARGFIIRIIRMNWFRIEMSSRRESSDKNRLDVNRKSFKVNVLLLCHHLLTLLLVMKHLGTLS